MWFGTQWSLAGGNWRNSRLSVGKYRTRPRKTKGKTKANLDPISSYFLILPEGPATRHAFWRRHGWTELGRCPQRVYTLVKRNKVCGSICNLRKKSNVASQSHPLTHLPDGHLYLIVLQTLCPSMGQQEPTTSRHAFSVQLMKGALLPKGQLRHLGLSSLLPLPHSQHPSHQAPPTLLLTGLQNPSSPLLALYPHPSPGDHLLLPRPSPLPCLWMLPFHSLAIFPELTVCILIYPWCVFLCWSPLDLVNRHIMRIYKLTSSQHRKSI